MVFCAVSAVMALMPNTPQASMVFRSACMPAPPDESEPEIARTAGSVDVAICAIVFILSGAHDVFRSGFP